MQVPKEITTKTSLRDAFGQALLALGRENPDVVVLTADLGESTRTHLFAKAFPHRFFQLGVAEQNLMGVAAGMALAGKIPFVCSFAVFSPGRNWDQLRVSVCYSQANVKVIGGHVGFSNGGDGGTHQALEDIAMTRCLPHLAVVSPADAIDTYRAVFALAEHKGPMYMRMSRTAPYHEYGWEENPVPRSFQFGKAQLLLPGKDVTLVATGLMVNEALIAAQLLAKKKISAEVINLHTIKPLDKESILHSIQKTGRLVTIEEHQCAGGMGSAVLEAVAGSFLGPLRVLGVQDEFGESGEPTELIEKHNLTSTHISKAVQQLLNQ